MMNYEKMLFFTKSEMSSDNSFATPFPPSHEQFVAPTTRSFCSSSDAYAAYADNFDLSLLPSDCESPTTPEYIPTTVLQHTASNNSEQAVTKSSDIKIEQTWQTNRYNDNNDSCIKEEPSQAHLSTTANFEQSQNQNRCQTLQHQKVQRTKSQPLLIPPPPYPHHHPYPSPESSPTQLEYSLHAQFGGGGRAHCSLSPSRATLYPPSPCPSLDTTATITHIKQEFHILPPSPPESSCEAPSPRSFTDIKTEPLDSDVEALIDINSLLEKSYHQHHQQQQHRQQQQHHHQPHHQQQQQEQVERQQEQHQHRHQFECISNVLPSNLKVKEEESPLFGQDHQLLRECLEDTTFQRKHNLKPLALEALIGGLGLRGDIEPVISLALEHARREAEETCTKLQISPDPKTWTTSQSHAWLRSTIEQFKLQPINDLELKFPEDGTALALLTEEEFVRRVPEVGSTIHAQLEIWKLAYSNGFEANYASPPTNAHSNGGSINASITAGGAAGVAVWQPDCGQKSECNMDEGSDEENDNTDNIADDEDGVNNGDETSSPPTSVLLAASHNSGNLDSCSTDITNGNANTTIAGAKPLGGNAQISTTRHGGAHIHLWQFLKELLSAPQVNGTAIRWIDRSRGIFKIEDSVRVAKLWGRRKNRPAMNYDKLSRSIRQYYKKGIMKKTERSQRLVYQFCHPYNL